MRSIEGGHRNFASGLGGIGILHAENVGRYPWQMESERLRKPKTF